VQGDKLASGAPSAQFSGPKLRYTQDEQFADLRSMTPQAFKEKYMVTQREYDMLIMSDGTVTDSLVKEMQEHSEVIERLTALDTKQEESLKRECFLEPFVALGLTGRIIVSRDTPVVRESVSKLALPRHLRKERERLPTTGHIIRAKVFDSDGLDVGLNFINKRILFGPMSGTAACFDGYPTWIILDVAEILCIVNKEDAEPIEEPLEPLT
jgi:hypothetical protein